jgi:hypothetical protein
MNFFYHSEGLQHGPVSWEGLLAAAASGRVRPADMIWHDGLPAWQPAATIPGLFAQPPGSPGGHPAAGPHLPYEAPRNNDAALKWVVPIGRSGWAIAAGYLGLFSVIAIGAPFAILTGILALNDIKKHPERGGKGRAIFGIAMGVIFTALYGFLILSVLLNSP